jgi:class 3 adenylate cyclase/tetratricopeptide (TPR) repeat protein
MRFCGQCGARLGEVCPNCDFCNPPGYLYCGMCGARLGVEAVPPAPAQPVPLEGERRRATVILADVRSSTDLMEQIGTEAWVQLMNRVLQILAAEVYRLGGRVDQFRGDGLVAFFGATDAHEDDPERAVLAALSMQTALQPHADELAVQSGLDLKLRVGVNTGEVIVASVGNPHQHREDTAMGEAVTLAARMEAAAEPGTVLVSAHTFQLVETNFEWQPLGEITVKGIGKPLAVYRPLRAHVLAREQPARRLPMPLTGRDAEFHQLIACIQTLCDGRGGIVLLMGEKGMGKSPLIDRARDQLAGQTILCQEKETGAAHAAVTWLFSSCHSYDQSTPYSMWLSALRDWLGVSHHESSAPETVGDLAGRLRAQAELVWGNQFERHYPYLATMLSLPLDAAQSIRVKYLSAEGLHRQLSQTLVEWVEALARRAPLVLVLNDMHWADATSLELLRRCLALCDSVPVLWLASFRPDRNSAVWEFRHHVETHFPHRLTAIELSPLSEPASRHLIEQTVGRGGLRDATAALVVQKAEGNPYYIQEILYALINQGVLEQDDQGNWRQVHAATTLDLPESLQSLLLARIDQLEPVERRVLQMAAVIGPLFWRNVLEAMTDASSLQASLTSLQRAQLVQERHSVTDLGMEYAFTPSLVRDAAYESLLHPQRVAYHLRVAEQIQRLVSPDCCRPYHSLLAYHYRQAAQPNRELYHALGAAEEARKVYANADALGHYTRAIELLDTLERDMGDENQQRSVLALRFEALDGRRQVQYPAGNIQAGHADARALLPLAQHMADDPAFMIDALLAQPEVAAPKSRADLTAGHAMAQHALDLARQLGDTRREMLALVSVSSAGFMLKDPTWHKVGEQALALTRQLGDLEMEVNILLGIGNAYGMDDLKRSTEYLEAALAICHRLEDKATESSLLAAIGPQFERSGDYYRQLTEYDRKRVLINRELGNRLGEGHALMFCGQIQAVYLGDFENGLADLRQALNRWEDTADKLFPLLRIAQVHTLQGRFDDAETLLKLARPLSEAIVLDIGHAGLWLVSAILDNARGDEAHLRHALEMSSHIKRMVADKLLSRQYLMAAMCEAAAAHMGLARCAEETERPAHLRLALESSQTALDIYEQFGFTQIVECTGEEILYRHSQALHAQGRLSDADEYLKRAYHEMMRKHDLIPPGQPDGEKPFRQTFLDNIALHRKIRAAYETRFSL